MSNNARVVPAPDGGHGEIGTAQYLQARAARVAPTVDMNPVLLKPEYDTGCQVVVHGAVRADLSRTGWIERSATLAAAARESFLRLAAAHALVIVEGAGSPAEINLAPHDFVNLGTARWARDAGPTQALLVADIDRGGAFAHLHGTTLLLLSLLPAVVPQLGPIYWCALAAITALLVWEHSIVRPDDLSRVNEAFFNANALIGVVLLAAIAAHASDLFAALRRQAGFFSRDKVREIAACGWVADGAPTAAALGVRPRVSLAAGLAAVAAAARAGT
jgi:hypothetical protein